MRIGERTQTKKYSLLIVANLCLFLFLGSFGIPPEVSNQEQRSTLAVSELVPFAGVNKKTAESLSEAMRVTLRELGCYTVLDRATMVERLDELKFEQTLFCEQQACLNQLGKTLNVQQVLGGSITQDETGYRLTLRVVEVESSSQVGEVSSVKRCPEDELDEFIQETLLELLVKIAKITPTPRATLASTATPTPTPTVTVTPQRAWYKKWYNVTLGALAVGGIIISNLPDGETNDPTETPTVTPTITPTETPYYTETPTSTPTSTPTFGCNLALNEAWVSNPSFDLKFHINCYESQNVPGAYPEALVNWYEARSSCVAQGKRLCSMDEWQLACRGISGKLYPYGNTYDPEICHTGQSENYGSVPSGSKGYCFSDFGIYDMSGNVSELTNEQVETNPSNYYRFGGDWTDQEQTASCNDQDEHNDFHANHRTGYRCCRDPDNLPKNSVEQDRKPVRIPKRTPVRALKSLKNRKPKQKSDRDQVKQQE